jgi:hypothetical protein
VSVLYVIVISVASTKGDCQNNRGKLSAQAYNYGIDAGPENN